MPKKKLLLVVGAGASVEFGIPTVAAVRGIISSAIQTRYPLLHAPATNLYEHIEETVSRYWTVTDRPRCNRSESLCRNTN
ncbi:MAG TPA: hypothetical protein VEI03_10375 [Stellaceae bacterium]|nr:hypothetical protein [Stellaceae bacterium]